MSKKVWLFVNNCPIREYTADGVSVGRCWAPLTDGHCPRHGDVRMAQAFYRVTGRLTDDPRYIKEVMEEQ